MVMNVDKIANLANIVSVILDFKNLSAIGKLGDLFTGRKPNVSGDSKTTPEGGAAGPTTVKENAAQIGELYALHGFLASYGDEPFEYKIPKTENHVFVEIVRRLKDGATKRLMQTLAAEVNSVKHRKVVGETKIKDPKDPEKFKNVPETEEWERQFNEKGPQIIRGLVWLVKYPGGKMEAEPEEKRIDWVVSVLEDFKIFDNLKDQATDFFTEVREFSTKTFGSADMWLHLGMAWWYTNWDTVQEQLNSAEGKRLKAAIKSAPEGAERKTAGEKLQRFLVEQCKDITRNPSRFAVWKARLPYIVVLAAIAGGIIVMGLYDPE